MGTRARLPGPQGAHGQRQEARSHVRLVTSQSGLLPPEIRHAGGKDRLVLVAGDVFGNL